MNCCWSLFLWGLALVVAAALLVGVYLYLRLDDEIRRHVERTLADHYPHFQVHVGKARFEKGRGIFVYDLSVLEPRRNSTPQPVLSVDEILLAGDLRVEDVMSGKPHLDRIVVRRPRLRAIRQDDGLWNVQALWPPPKLSDLSPEMQIEDATLILEDASRHDVAPLSIRGIDLKLAPRPDAVRAIPAGVAASPQPLPRSTQQFTVLGSASGSPARELTVSGTIGPEDGTLELTADIHSLGISPEFMATIPGGLPAQLQYLQLFGNADATVRLSRPAANRPLDWSADVSLSRGRLEFAAFPQSLTEVAAKIKADSQRLIIEQFTGKLGTADVVLACERKGWNADATLGLAGRIVGLTVDYQLQAASPGAFERLWQRFQPSGTVDAEVRLTFDGQQWRPELTARCRGLSLTDAEAFPYPLEQATGTVELNRSPTGDGMELKLDLVGQANGQPVRVTGDLDRVMVPAAAVSSAAAAPALDPQTAFAAADAARYTQMAPGPAARKPTGWIEVGGSGIHIHEQLLAALPDRTESFVRSLAPEGTIDVRWRCERTDPDQEHANTAIELQLSDCAIQYGPFPYPLQHIHGLVTAQNGHWILKDLQGEDRQGSAIVTCQGESQSEAAGQRLHLEFRGTNVPLDENLKQAVSPQVQRAWSELRPQGRVDFIADVQREPGQIKPVIQVDLRPHEQTVSLEPTFFPYRLEQVDGRALVSDGRVELQQARARHGRSTFATQGIWQATPDGGWQAVLSGLSADRLTLEPEFLVALPPGVQKVLERLRPAGSFDLYSSTLGFTRRGDTAPIASTWDVQLACHQAALHGDLRLDNLTGGIRLMGQCDGPNCASYGELAVDSLIWNDVQLTDVHGPFWSDASICLFGQAATEKLAQPARRLTAQAYGGTLAADIQLQHTGHPRYHVDLSLGAVELGRIVNERLGGPKDVAGTVSGKLRLDGAGHSIYALNGNGDLHVVDANIYKLPALVALLKVLSNRLPDTTAFDRCDLVFDIHGEHIHFQQLNLLGDAVSLYGRGETNFDRNLNLEFYSLVGPGGFSIPLLSNMVGQASRQILQLKVEGNLDNPTIRREAFPAVGQMLEQIRADAQQGASAVAAPAAAMPWPLPRR